MNREEEIRETFEREWALKKPTIVRENFKNRKKYKNTLFFKKMALLTKVKKQWDKEHNEN